MSEISMRIAEFKEALGIKNQSTFAGKLKISRTTLIGYEDGTSTPSIAFLIKIRELYDVNINWLLFGTGEMFLTNTGKETPIPSQIPKLKAMMDQQLEEVETKIVELRKILKAPDTDTPEPGMFASDPEPDYDAEETVRVLFAENVAAGPPIAQSEDISEYKEVPRRFIKTRPEDYYATRVVGESMTEAGIPDGSLILVRKSDVPKNGEIQIVRREGKSTLKRLREHEDHHWTLEFDDNTNRYISIGPDEEWHVQGDFVVVLPDIE